MLAYVPNLQLEGSGPRRPRFLFLCSNLLPFFCFKVPFKTVRVQGLGFRVQGLGFRV